MFEQLKELICNYVDVNPDDITPESRFIEDLGFNSFDFMSLLGEVEETMNVQVDDQEIINLHTVEEAVKYLESIRK
ncbi:acyl carrier protein [Porcipelethomonas sp.]|uniref:acyl carrier protein n=1 Tax=Porcipelethomonas sp. TaxID=2981675 RepID=UPI003EF55DED